MPYFKFLCSFIFLSINLLFWTIKPYNMLLLFSIVYPCDVSMSYLLFLLTDYWLSREEVWRCKLFPLFLDIFTSFEFKMYTLFIEINGVLSVNFCNYERILIKFSENVFLGMRGYSFDPVKLMPKSL